MCLFRITSPLLLIAMVASFFGYRKLTAGPNTWKVRVDNVTWYIDLRVLY